MFNNAQSIRITGGSFNITTNVNIADGPSLDLLYRHVAPNAILNAGGRADEVRCHPGTREEVIGRIEKWTDTQDSLAASMLWLSGPAGAGKSAIMQTIAERCKQRGVPHANFFFFRADASRSNASPLIATLLHQIILLYPSLRDRVATLLSDNPLVFNSTLEDQLEKLLVTPLYSVQQSSSAHYPLLLLIDGLDECDSETKRSQQQILRAFDQVLAQRPQACPLRLMVASRDESHIRAAFNGVSSQCLRLYLDDQYSPESDIRIFVMAQFEKVRKTHPLAYTLGLTWPSSEDVDYIVEKSSGQFIYAATVMRFILDSSASPKLSLERVQGAARLATQSPFSHLDAIYTYILTQADDQEAVKDILHAQLLIMKLSSFSQELILSGQLSFEIPFVELLRLYNPRYTEDVVLSCLADLTPIARYASGGDCELLFHHASFPDYLLDQSRSRDCFIDVTAFNYKILPMVWGNIQNEHHDETSVWVQFSILGIYGLEKLPPGLMNTMVSSKDIWSLRPLRYNTSLFKTIYKLCITDDDINNFKRIVRQWINSYQVITFGGVKNVPFSRRYFQMARAERFDAPDEEMAAALCPTSEFDRQESAQWLPVLIHRIHKEIYPSDVKLYNQLLKAWISWASENNIPCYGLDDLPDAQKYIRGSRTKNWALEKFSFKFRSTRK